MMISFLIFTLFAVTQRDVLADCSFTPTAITSPLVTNQNFTTIYKVGDDETIFVECVPGWVSDSIAENGEEALCEGSTNIRIISTDTVIDYNSLECKSEQSNPFPYTVQATDESCSTSGTLFKVGYPIYGDFNTVYSVCFDESSLTALNVEAYFDLSVKDQREPDEFFDSASLFGGTDLSSLYTNQAEIFEKLSLSNYITDDTYLVPASLLPYSLAGSPFQRSAAVDYVNVVPMWNEVYKIFRDLFILLGDGKANLEIRTLNVTTLLDDNNETVEVYLEDGQIPVPRWVWIRFPVDVNPTYLFYNNVFDDIENTKAERDTLCGSNYLDYNNMVLCWNPKQPLLSLL